MGSDPRQDPETFDDECPQHQVYLGDYYIGRIPVTFSQYAVFVKATGYRSTKYGGIGVQWTDGAIPDGRANHPVRHLTWGDAVAFCRWLSNETNCVFRLPTEAEWEKAARGTDGRIYPWGSWKELTANTIEAGVETTTPVGHYLPQGISPYGCVDMAGNVWEWTSTRWGQNKDRCDYPYPYRDDDGREDAAPNDYHVVRGGSYHGKRKHARCAYRDWWDKSDVGLRLAADI